MVGEKTKLKYVYFQNPLRILVDDMVTDRIDFLEYVYLESKSNYAGFRDSIRYLSTE